MDSIALIGIGQMGHGMLISLLRAGFIVRAFDINPPALQRATEAGATAAASIPDVLHGCSHCLTMLPTAAATRSVYLDKGGVIDAAPPGLTCIDLSTIDPQAALEIGAGLGERGIGFMDCPVSGGTIKAREGLLTIMASGSAAERAAAAPILDALGKVVPVGGLGSGSAAKLANNILAASHMVATSEAYLVAGAYGIDPQVMTRILEGSSGDNWILRNMHPVPGIRPDSPSSHGYQPSFTTQNMLEMLDLIRRAAAARDLPLVTIPALQTLWQLAANHGFGALDCTSVYQFLQPSSASAQARKGSSDV